MYYIDESHDHCHNIMAHSIFNRVSNRKGRSMQNEFVSVVSSRPTLGKIETTPQISYAFGNVCEKAILNHKPKYKKWLRDQNYVHRGRRTSCQVYHF